MSSTLSKFHAALKADFSKKYQREVFDSVFQANFDIENASYVRGSGITYILQDTLSMEMIKHMMKFTARHQITFTIGYFEPVEITFFIGTKSEF